MRAHIERINPNRGDAEVPLNSADVLVPAFISAYKGESIDRNKDVKIVRRIGKMLPNWKFTLDLLSKAPILKEGFKSFNITHGYKCTYNINSFSKHQGWDPLYDDLNGFGIIQDEGEVTPFLVRSTKVDNVNLTVTDYEGSDAGVTPELVNGRYAIQVAAFKTPDTAYEFVNSLRQQGYNARIIEE